MHSYVKLSQAIRQVFINSDKYMMDKYVPEFTLDGKYFADTFNMTMVEPRDSEPPIIYHTYSPYDIVSKKAPDQALVFCDGELVLNTPFAAHVKQRTGVMSSLLLQALGHDKLDGKLLLIGTGKIAHQALLALKEHFPGLETLDYLNTSGQDSEFVAFAAEHGVAAEPGSLDAVGEYDYIICHSSAQSPILTAAMKDSIKPGAFIASFVSENFRELDEAFYDTKDANVVIDWDKTIPEAPDLQSAVDKKIADANLIIRLKDLLTGDKKPDLTKKYTVYRSHGTPMQNLAMLQLLLNQKSES